uniref:Astacin domain-containing protein n=1 Tax=Strongyloides papillosus TaxID=174720 RepID=A0A0N5B5Y7_STREA
MQHATMIKNIVQKQVLLKECEKKCVKSTKKYSTKCANITLPFIRFFYDKNKKNSDFNFNGSTSLWKENVYNMEVDVSCNKKAGCIAKKVLMFLGLIPTVRRKDRDIYITVNYRNIYRKYQMYYDKLYDVPLNTNYDYSSIAHFADNYGGSSSEPTFDLKRLSDSGIKLTGQEIRPTFLDLEWLYTAYCKNKFAPTVKCEKGFPKSDGSETCVCPTGFTGKTCKDLQYQNKISCPGTVIHVGDKSGKKELNFNEKKNCTVQLIAPSEKRIRINVDTMECVNNNPCFEDDCLQIKYRPSMTNTDLCLCGTLKN